MIAIPPLQKVCPVCTMDEQGRTQRCVIDDHTRSVCRCSCHRPRWSPPLSEPRSTCAIVGCAIPRRGPVSVGLPQLCAGHDREFRDSPESVRVAPEFRLRPTALTDFRDRLWKVRAIEIEAEKRAAALKGLV